MTNPLEAVCTYLRGRTELASIDDRIFVASLPNEQIKTADGTNLMPRSAVVISGGGGVEKATNIPIHEQRFDTVCYSASDAEAHELDLVVYGILKGLDRQVVDGVLLHNVTAAGGAANTRDPQTMWPAARRPYTIRADEREVV